MKKCPNCEKTFEDNMKFCQSDGTRLVVVADESAPEDPYKTMVASDIKLPVEEKSDPTPETPLPETPVEPEPLEIPEQPVPPIAAEPTSPEPSTASEPVADEPEDEPEIDPMKTMVVSGSDTASNLKIPETPELKDEPEPMPDAPENPSPEIPHFSEPEIHPPDLSTSDSVDVPQPEPQPEPPAEPPAEPRAEPPAGTGDLKKETEEVVIDQTSSSLPIPSPFDESMPPGMAPPETPPFHQSDEPVEASQPEEEAATPPASPFDDPQPEPKAAEDSANDPFASNKMPEAASESAPADDPFANNQVDAPLAATSGSEVSAMSGSSNGEGENKTMAFVSLGLGIFGLICLGPLGGIGAIVTGYMAKNNIKSDPSTYGGGTLATIGMVLGVITMVIYVLFLILYIALIVLAN